MAVYPELRSGIFIEELKNRFLCTVNIGGEIATCYVPSSCRLSNFMNPVGKQVLLKPNATANTRTPYSLFAIRHRNAFVLLNLSQVNRIVFDEISSRRFAHLGKRKRVTCEYMIEGYRSDLYIHDSKTLVEIKGILSFSQTAVFPTIYSERAEHQLQTISSLLDKGYHACFIFVSLTPSVSEIRINKEMSSFNALFHECISKGMTTCAVSISVTNGVPRVKRSISVNLLHDNP